MNRNGRTFGEILFDLRKDRGLNQDQVAAGVGLQRQTISKYENGKAFPSETSLKNLASFFDVSIDYLFDCTTIQTPTSKLDETLICINGRRITLGGFCDNLLSLPEEDRVRIIEMVEITKAARRK